MLAIEPDYEPEPIEESGEHQAPVRSRRKRVWMTKEEFRSLRHSVGASREDVAHALGMHLQSIVHLETGKRRVTRQRARQLKAFVVMARRRAAEVERELRKEVMRRVWDRPVRVYHPRKPKPLLQRIFNP